MQNLTDPPLARTLNLGRQVYGQTSALTMQAIGQAAEDVRVPTSSRGRYLVLEVLGPRVASCPHVQLSNFTSGRPFTYHYPLTSSLKHGV
jgi:hypothetical protein